MTRKELKFEIVQKVKSQIKEWDKLEESKKWIERGDWPLGLNKSYPFEKGFITIECQPWVGKNCYMITSNPEEGFTSGVYEAVGYDSSCDINWAVMACIEGMIEHWAEEEESKKIKKVVFNLPSDFEKGINHNGYLYKPNQNSFEILFTKEDMLKLCESLDIEDSSKLVYNEDKNYFEFYDYHCIDDNEVDKTIIKPRWMLYNGSSRLVYKMSGLGLMFDYEEEIE